VEPLAKIRNAGMTKQKRSLTRAVKVDAVMMSRVSIEQKRPGRAARAWSIPLPTGRSLTEAGARISPRIVSTADANQPPPGGERDRTEVQALRTGISAFAIRHGRAIARPSGVRASQRTAPGTRIQSRGGAAGDHNDHAHANRCAPPEETRVAVLKGNRIEEFDFESADHKQIKGNIYLAKVTRVEPSLQAAFVDFGGNRHGFLAFSEIHPDYYQIPKEDREALLAEEAAHAEEEAALRAAEEDADDGWR
jgi:hypothetical protein